VEFGGAENEKQCEETGNKRCLPPKSAKMCLYGWSSGGVWVENVPNMDGDLQIAGVHMVESRRICGAS
jgi:hypothetical protein